MTQQTAAPVEPSHLIRFHDDAGCVTLKRFRITKRTAKGVWIDVYHKPKFVLNNSTKRYAYPTEEQAKESFLRRKWRQESILESQLRNIRIATQAIKDGRLNERPTPEIYELEFT